MADDDDDDFRPAIKLSTLHLDLSERSSPREMLDVAVSELDAMPIVVLREAETVPFGEVALVVRVHERGRTTLSAQVVVKE